jgi:hypothetical protein
MGMRPLTTLLATAALATAALATVTATAASAASAAVAQPATRAASPATALQVTAVGCSDNLPLSPGQTQSPMHCTAGAPPGAPVPTPTSGS